MMSTGDPRVALIHDELTRRGGAEIIFEELADLFPDADLYTLYAGHPVLRVKGKLKPVHASYLQKFPVWFRRHPGRMLPFLSHAAEQFDFADYDLVISSASGFAKAIVTRAAVPHLCYCHTPTRYLWDSAHEVAAQRGRFSRWPFRLLQHYLRLLDFTAAQRVDVFIANSRYTQQRIWTYYRRRSEIVYPPIDTAFFVPSDQPRAPDAPFLLVGRLTPSKHFEQAIRVAEKLHLPLTVVGVGQERAGLQRLAGPYTRLISRVSRDELRQYYRTARALLQPGIEDFGMTAAEAVSCGTPVIAYGVGGVTEVVTSPAFGYLYRQPGEEGLAEALRQFLSDNRSWDSRAMQGAMERFGREQFRDAIYKLAERGLESRTKA
jgi:glycosyltransferase involved in cell wall biosynthesis